MNDIDLQAVFDTMAQEAAASIGPSEFVEIQADLIRLFAFLIEKAELDGEERPDYQRCRGKIGDDLVANGLPELEINAFLDQYGVLCYEEAKRILEDAPFEFA